MVVMTFSAVVTFWVVVGSSGETIGVVVVLGRYRVVEAIEELSFVIWKLQ